MGNFLLISIKFKLFKIDHLPFRKPITASFDSCRDSTACAILRSPWKWSLILPLHRVDILCTDVAAAEANLGSCNPANKNCNIGSERNVSMN